MTLTLEVGTATDVGRSRNHNEDNVLALNSLFAVADGMGGHAAGEVASTLALATLARLADDPEPGRDEVRAAIADANAVILKHMADHEESAGMGTTVAGLCLSSVAGVPHWIVFNVGDSRVYRLLGEGLEQVTVDHSEVQELMAGGEITADEARVHPRRNVVTRSMGTLPPPEPDIWVLPAQAGERFIVCSDGLTGEVDDDTIARTLLGEPDAHQAAQTLVACAVDAGGHDNVTVVVINTNDDAADSAVIDTSPRKELRGVGE